MAHGSSKQRSALECNKHTVEYMCRQTTRFSQVYFCIFFFFHISTFTFFEFSENRLLSVSQNALFPNGYGPNVFTWYVQCKAHLIKIVLD